MWHVYVIALVLGLVTVLDQPARQVFVNELVGPTYLRNAISVNSTTFQLGGLIGPALAGLLLTAVGAGWAFAANARGLLLHRGHAAAPAQGPAVHQRARPPRARACCARGCGTR